MNFPVNTTFLCLKRGQDEKPMMPIEKTFESSLTT